MGRIRDFTPVKLIIGVLISRTELKDGLVSRLEKEFGPIDYESRQAEFVFTHYYDEEMGPPIFRFFLSFLNLVQPDLLAEFKIRTNEIENLYSAEEKRPVNLDPGMLSLSRFVLATTKENAHRIPLSKGIYADLTLLYHKEGFHPFEWTYPDFRSAEYHEILLKVREMYKEQLKRQGGLPRF